MLDEHTRHHIAIQETLRALFDNHGNIEQGFLLGHVIR